ncbi:MAG: restriction endonuclease subunit S [Flavobacterium sp.]|nr:MAG: restriction endonuclease subunit S [Flavobacterium sp.]
MNNTDAKPTINHKNTQTLNGYKKTAIGTIPEDWEVKKLFEICNFTNGKGHEQIIETSGKYILVNSKFVSTQGMIFKTIDTNLCPLKKNDIAIVMSDVPNGKAIAKCFYVDKDDLYSLNQRVGNIRINSMANSTFIYYQLNRNKYYLKFDDGIKQTNLRKDEVLNCPILFPPLPEQHKIAEILSTWDDAIAKCKATIISLKVRNKGLSQQLLTGKKRLEGFNDKWTETTIEKITKNFSNKNKELIDARIYSVTNSNGFVYQSDHFSREVAGDDLTDYKIIRKNEFAYNPARINVGSIAFFTDEIGIISSLYVCFKTNDKVLNEFFIEWLKIEKTKHDIERYGEGGVRIYLWYDLFKKLKINLPSIEEQNAIVEVLAAANQELKNYETKLEALQLQKKGLMQQLLTGKIRVNVK